MTYSCVAKRQPEDWPVAAYMPTGSLYVQLCDADYTCSNLYFNIHDMNRKQSIQLSYVQISTKMTKYYKLAVKKENLSPNISVK